MAVQAVGRASFQLISFLEENHIDGLLFIGDGICDPDMYYLGGFFAPDKFALLASDQVALLVSSMEKGRAKEESSADQVVSTSDYDILGRHKSMGSSNAAYSSVLKDFLQDRGITRLGVPFYFPAGYYKSLSSDLDVVIMDSPVREWRAVKSQEEMAAISSVQAACEEAMSAAVSLISRSSPKGEILYLDGAPLTAETIKAAIDMALLERGCEAQDTIVAGGPEAANPHSQGSGPLPADATIVIDIFPRSKYSRYYADMTRTVLRGEASPEALDLYDAVLEAQQAGILAVRAGVSGREVHAKVDEAFRERGYTEREGRGFIHSTGHGVGLEVHEKPSLSIVGDCLLENNVVTVEPGLYYPEVGSVRIEDLVVVTREGCHNLTRFEKRLVL